MNESLLDISKKIDPTIVSLFRDFVDASGEISWLMIGAAARDVFLHYQYERPVQRATRDVDLGVQLGSWEEYQELKSRLLKGGMFNLGGSEHRLLHKTGLPLDLIPFGKLASENNRIRWPKDSSSEMNVAGYEDALSAAIFVQIAFDPDLKIPIAPPAAIAILKILAWFDNPHSRAKDIEDLAYLINEYLDLGNWDRLNGKDSDLTQSHAFNVRFAGAELLGRDISRISILETKDAVIVVLKDELKLAEASRMVLEMSKKLTATSLTDCLSLLKSLVRGIESPAGRPRG